VKPSEAPDEDTAATLQRLRLTALRVLTRREHGSTELQRKLERKGFAPEHVRLVLDKLRAEGLLNDVRFAESAVRHHILRGHGPIRIRAELRAQGLPAAEIDQAIRTADVEWDRLACEVRRKRFSLASPKTAAERAKQGRFLQYRGFDSEQIRAAFRGLSCDDSVDYSELQDEDAADRDL
jgi:regulatory protein